MNAKTTASQDSAWATAMRAPMNAPLESNGLTRGIDWFLAHVEEAARRAATAARGIRLLGVQADYDQAESFRRSGRVDAVRVLAGVGVQVQLTFDLPLHALPDATRIEFVHPAVAGYPGLWLCADDADDEDALDIVAACFQDNESLLDALIVPLIASEEFLDDPAWAEMTKVCYFRVRAAAVPTGLRCRMRIELDAR
jgi:hypothetical protein